jgi:hypothetical protein
VKSSETSRARGYDAGRVNGRRRHILMDTMGPLLLVLVFSANAQDKDGARRLQSLCHAGVMLIYLDNLLIICR